MNDESYNAYSLLLDRTARKVKQYAQQQFKEMGFNITVDQWLVLKHLYEHPQMKQNALADLINKDNPHAYANNRPSLQEGPDRTDPSSIRPPQLHCFAYKSRRQESRAA